ncbi:DUF2288 domain-containing protein [Neisseria elongata]|uniref:DUF2288 domain-containing protein n=1 Tax=Neisseria elongata TaxID=495 RepID=UPI0024B13EC0|nr:DUF2288 domain-containing protein [Neisseria elongata]
MSEPYLNDKLNLETARIAWTDLQVHFARGAAVYVAPELDLVAVARLVADDDGREIARLMAEGKFGMVSEAQAAAFWAENREMWAVVVAPWVLVQPAG